MKQGKKEDTKIMDINETRQNKEWIKMKNDEAKAKNEKKLK